MKKNISIILSLVLFLIMFIVACNTSLANTMVIGSEYSAVSSNYQATQAAFEGLQNGGNAADALRIQLRPKKKKSNLLNLPKMLECS